ncbi:MAG: glucosylglycerol 3-phosphatase [Synechococcales bacterium]|nr:glucosylglycerol 3-phosphatase [Synechococcales bacterium]
MTHLSLPRLHEASLSLDHSGLIHILSQVENLLVIQDLDGVCMGLVKDPLTRTIDPAYVEATRAFGDHFYVLTNGEHIGQRGVNGILERTVGDRPYLQQSGSHLPGLAAGGVQWQDRHGEVTHPGVSEAELTFLAQVPQRMEARLRQFFAHRAEVNLDLGAIAQGIQTAVLDNVASPTANLNSFYELLRHQPDTYRALQQAMKSLTDELLQEAEQQGLTGSFFVHYAPNLGRDSHGLEILRPATETDSGTTDFQFMLRGAVKEAGVLFILNHYYYRRTGTHPLGPDFNVRQAPADHAALLELVKSHFDPALMPRMVGVGDTVNSQVLMNEGKIIVRRGGSDRNFLQLIQDIGTAMGNGNVIVYVDSSQGEVKNRRPLKLSTADGALQVVDGPGDPGDTADPLTLNVVFPGGHSQYCRAFQTAAQQRLRQGWDGTDESGVN